MRGHIFKKHLLEGTYWHLFDNNKLQMSTFTELRPGCQFVAFNTAPTFATDHSAVMIRWLIAKLIHCRVRSKTPPLAFNRISESRHWSLSNFESLKAHKKANQFR